MIQIDMDMPVSCFYCPIKQRILTLGGKCMCFCGLIKHELNDTTKRHESCPLVKVKDGEQKQVQPERKTGRWIESNPQDSKVCRLMTCSECGKAYIVNINIPYEDWTEAHKFCVECGADMRGKEE